MHKTNSNKDTHYGHTSCNFGIGHKKACLKQTQRNTMDIHHATLVLYDTKEKWDLIKN